MGHACVDQWWVPGCAFSHLVDGAGDSMLHTIHDFFIIGHPLGVNMNKWVEFVATEAEWASDGHVRLGTVVSIRWDEEGEQAYADICLVVRQ